MTNSTSSNDDDNSPSAASTSWEDAETQPQLSHHHQKNNNNISAATKTSRERASLNSSSLDLDKTLPLPADMEAELMESQRVNGRLDDDEMSVDETSSNDEGTNLLAKLQKWTSPKNNHDNSISETDVATLLSFAAKLRSGEVPWNHTNYRVILLMVKVAMLSFTASSVVASAQNSGGVTTTVEVGATTTTANTNASNYSAASSMEVQYARRLLTDAILPFASLNSSSSTDAVWNAKLIQSIVLHYLLPSVVVHHDDDEVSSATSSTNGGGNITTTAVDILLDHCLARMDADEISQVVRLNPGHDISNTSNNDESLFSKIDTVDSILDILCNVPTECAKSLLVRPTATTAIINSLRDLESNDPGRLSRCRVWRSCVGGGRTSSLIYIGSSSGSNNNNNSNHSNVEMKECHYTFIDRPTHLLQQAISTLKSCHQQRDYDSIPPLVYQLGLLPLSIMRRANNNNNARGGGGGEWCVKTAAEKKVESEKQRGVRLRRMCLEGIVSVLDDDQDDVWNHCEGGSTANLPSNGGVLHSASKDLFGAKDEEREAQFLQEAWRWARYNSLAHVGAHARTDPEMAKAVLSLLRGEIMTTSSSSTSDETIAPFRYQRSTPFKLAMGLAMGTSIPRMRNEILEIIRDLVVEEETIRIKCGRGVNGDVIGLGHPWMDCLVKSVQMAGAKNNGLKGLASKGGRENNGIGHVLSNIIAVVKFGADTESAVKGCGRGLDLLPSLISLGFLCVDSVKRDEVKTSSTNAVSSACSLAPTMDISSFGDGSKAPTADTSAAHATASTGRFVLCCLFYQSAASASHYLSSSLTTSHGSSSSSDGGTSLCRNILKTSFDKFCSMAPNSMEHSLLLTDLLNFSPKPFLHMLMDRTALNDGLMDKQREEIIGLCLATSHLRDIIETLSNVVGGGMNGQVARDVISPAVGRLLLVQATQRHGLGSLWKKTDIEDHIDHAFLLAKKALFSADVEKRKAAANLLVALLGAASVASSLGRASTWTSVIYEIKGCLRRCLTQHQSSVRMEAYSALVALLPKSVESTAATQTQDSVSPTSNASPASTVSPLALRSQRGGMSGMIIPPIGRIALVRVVSEVLLSSLDRYVTTPQEESHERDARRKRAAQGVGLSQMEADDEDGNDIVDKSMPLRFENIISKIPQRNVVQPKKGSKKTVPIGQMLFNEALSRINEPLSFLVASCAAASSLSNDNDSQDELKKALTQLRRRMAACSDIDEYLVWLKSNKQIFDIKDDGKRAEEMAVFKISTLVSVAVLSEAVLSTCEWENGNLVESDNDIESTNQEVEDLFNLRVDAIDRAAEIMSSFVTQKSKKASSKKSKKLKEVDGNSQDDTMESKKAAKKSKKGEEVATYTTVKASDINSITLARNKKLVEEVVNDLCPSMDKGFLTHSLRRFGANASKKGEADGIFDGEESTDAATRLYGCAAFRRFLLTKSILLTSGSSFIVTPGVQFCSLDEPELDEKLVSFRLAACFSMGPLLFSEFCANCNQLDKTSAAPNHSLSSSDPSLAQLSLRAFNFCVRGMNFHAPNHPMSRAKRVGALLSMSMRMASSVVPASKDGWNFFLALKKDALKIKGIDIPDDALELKKSLLPFMSSRSTLTSHEGDEAPNRICLFSELQYNRMHGEALECAQLVSAAASAFSEPNLREELSCSFLRAWELGKEVPAGVLGLDFSDVETGNVIPLSAVIDIALQLSHQLDGETHVPLLGSPKDVRAARSAMGLPLTVIENWPDRHHERLRREIKKSGGFSITGVLQQLVMALHAALGHGESFSDEIESELTRKEVKLSCVKAEIEKSDSSEKERGALGSLISSSIEAGLDNAEFVSLKIIPHMKGSSLDIAQRSISLILFSASKVISTSAPFAENVDCNASFSSSLLKSTKRLYSILVRLILSYMNNPESLASKETKYFLDYITSTFMPRISALLLALSKQTTTKDGKFIAESKIESHGKISALLVFEKEKLDNALLKVGAKLKSAGLEEESAWLEEQVVAVHSRDFEINTDEVENAMAMEAPKKKTKKAAGSKRKVKSEPLKDDSKKKKKKLKAEAEEEEEEEEDDEEEEMNDSDAVAEVVDGESDEEGDSEEESEDEEDSDEDTGIDLGNLTEEMGSESEEEAEFSD